MWISITALVISVTSIAINVWLFALSGPRVCVTILPLYRQDGRDVWILPNQKRNSPVLEFPESSDDANVLGKLRRTYEVVVRNNGRHPVDVEGIGLLCETSDAFLGCNQDGISFPKRIESGSTLTYRAQATSIALSHFKAAVLLAVTDDHKTRTEERCGDQCRRLRAAAKLGNGKIVKSRQTVPLFLPNTIDLDGIEYQKKLNNILRRLGAGQDNSRYNIPLLSILPE